uniref:RNA helicase n=1 Tax=Eucampia antarctica TaxID=49252 RepID=A0A6U0U7B8_9STRA
MEFEIIDAIKSNDVTIICSETGSGKSTQIPQFLYESGITLGNAKNEVEDDGLVIGVTQPRRVAAVSTAKRVCYEMGHSSDNGQSIRNQHGNGNLVAYQTRYESAGLGSKTRVKFMTDGILLSEIKSDLLLRKYSAIVLDEAHERNLNTDVLLGLLSASLPLRRKAAAEGSLPPLKLIIMSATLRVEDFTGNDKLFPGNPPVVVKVSGRTYPVTIHHSKLTELDNYETVAYQKVCKIHRKLPQGGILVFMTGKQEIIRMVNRLRKALTKKGTDENSRFTDTKDIQISENSLDDLSNSNAVILRDMDDEEADGDLFGKNDDQDDFDDVGIEDDDVDKTSLNLERQNGGCLDTNSSLNVIILPLYSLMSAQEQAKVFAPLSEGTRLIVVATNIAETSITIPGVSYVVDIGRQKCRNYHAGTGVASYDVMWISKAAADQRAGRAGRTGPGHCYRLYSSSIYDRHFDQFALPEVLTRPLEDVVLAMKAMNIFNIAEFPFPTPPDSSQLNAAIKLLANIGCVDLSRIERHGGDGSITKLGAAVATLPLGVRYGKMLLVAAQANLLDYAIALVSILSESSPFIHQADDKLDGDDLSNPEDDDNFLSELDEVDRNAALKKIKEQKKTQRKRRWKHDGGDILAGMLAIGAYSYASRGSKETKHTAETCQHFCEENGLNSVIMGRIQKMRVHLAKLAKQRLGKAEGFAAKVGGILNTMSPPNKSQEDLLKQAIASGLLDNVARRLPPGTLLSDKSVAPRAAYFSCRSTISQPLFIDQKSVLFQRDFRYLPEWVCYDSVVRKPTKDGSTISTMRNVTPIDVSWLGKISQGSQLLFLGDIANTPIPMYDSHGDRILCSVTTKYGDRGWLLPPNQVDMKKALAKSNTSGTFLLDDQYRWFARFLLEGKIIKELSNLPKFLNDEPAIITRKKLVPKVTLLVSALRDNEVCNAGLLRKHWAEKDNKFLFKNMKAWAKRDEITELKKVWISAIKKNKENWEK